MTGDLRIENVDILYPHCIAGTHYRRYIMRVLHIFEHYGEPGLAFIQYIIQPFGSFGCHAAKFGEKI